MSDPVNPAKSHYTQSDVRDALAYAAKRGVKVSPNPALSNNQNYRSIMQAVDDACHAIEARRGFVRCTCCTHVALWS